MPIQKGKRRKRTRRHNGAREGIPVQEANVAAAPAKPRESKATRRRWEPPLSLNLGVGIFLFILGLLFTATAAKGFNNLERIIILLGYFALSGLYLSKAFRQYRSRRGS